MGARSRVCAGERVSGVLSLFPHLIKRVLLPVGGGCVGVAGWNTYRWRSGREEKFGMLLGPEKTPGLGGSLVRSWSWLSNASAWCSVVCSWWRPGEIGVWLCVECCIVDASISLFVGKCVRAHGGCLGIRGR